MKKLRCSTKSLTKYIQYRLLNVDDYLHFDKIEEAIHKKLRDVELINEIISSKYESTN